jgi:hypothetical protein
MEPFYSRLQKMVFAPSESTIGPWSREAQHGGPPSALLGRALEREAGENKQIVRLGFDILKPVPLSPMTVAVSTVRPGKKVSLHEASIEAGGRVVMRATAWAMRTAELDLPDAPASEANDDPQSYEQMDPNQIAGSGPMYLHATEWRFVSGAFLEPGPAVAWIRTLVALVDGEEDSALTRVLAVADSASGVSGALDFREWLYINTDLSVYLHRMPQGPWIKLDAETTPQPSGVALCSGRLSDRRGPIGTTSQALFISPR